ncbi:MAG: sugar nucleotide-binding protein [Candidatus Omnitrophica bacterium]|nr:sugar nucleotide-binding protein [Candidatus Omnitrophota bacterium]
MEKNKGRRILITGAGGFIGSALLKELSDLSPVAVYHNTKPSMGYHSLKSVDLRDEQALRVLMMELKPEIVYHFAALASPKRNEEDPQLARETHLKVTENLVNNLPEGSHIVFTSTDKVFDGSDPNPDENSKPHPKWLYGRLKVECENLIRSRVPRHHIVRLPIVHALGEEWVFKTGSAGGSFIDKGMADLRLGKKVEAFNNVERGYVRISRLVDLFKVMLEDEHYGLYHVSSPMMSYYERMKQLCTHCGIAWQDLLVPSLGTAIPMTQNLNTVKLSSTFKIVFD